MRIVFALDGRPELDAREALGLAELLADHQLAATLRAAVEIREAVIAEEDPGTPPATITLDREERQLLARTLSGQTLLGGERIERLARALADSQA